ncbi:MAG: 8-oxo-dGTP diphosphatase [Patescibacteria group bacterium]|nr:NUDIX hydrolase [Candidatus Saccharibacteria bacterium]MDQ5963377.1 8-oxo-dGTP diphosphatase [Patescibacteria group bacterium]
MSEQQFQVGVKALVRRDDGKILLLREADHPDSYWDLPGGRVELGESLAETLQRELREEICGEIAGEPELITAVVAKKVIRDARGEFALLLAVYNVAIQDPESVRSGEEGVVLEWFTPIEGAERLRDKFPEEFQSYARGLV